MYGFGPTFRNWIKSFNTDVSSAVISNGHLSEFVLLERVRQSYPLSPYLFIILLEFLSAALKNDLQVSGVTINGSEYLLSQYADDSALILGDEPKFS